MSDAILPVYGPAPIAFDRGQGARLYDAQGRCWLDFIAGIAVNSLGHAHPALVSALSDQAARLWHVSNMFRIPGQERLAERYAALTFADRVFFTNSGTEAIEAAIKIARRYHWSNGAPERDCILSFTGSFHGRTLAAINAGGQDKYREGFGPRLPGFRTFEFGDHEALAAAIREPDVAAVLIEPVQGEGGVRAVPESCLTALRRLCTDHGVLLIYDEVQCGAGRTGKLFDHQWARDAAPDILAAAKGIGGGFPMGACLTTQSVAAAMTKGSHGSTFGGGPLAMAVGNAVLDVLTAEGFMESVQRVAGVLTQGLESLKDRYPELVIGVSGRGLLRGLRLSVDPLPLRLDLMERGLLVGTAGGNVLRLAPPLIITDSDVLEAVGIMDQGLAAMSGR
jgi:acetylornithine/N-succinyldiaminopimelate aminotransferase